MRIHLKMAYEEYVGTHTAEETGTTLISMKGHPRR